MREHILAPTIEQAVRASRRMSLLKLLSQECILLGPQFSFDDLHRILVRLGRGHLGVAQVFVNKECIPNIRGDQRFVFC